MQTITLQNTSRWLLQKHCSEQLTLQWNSTSLNQFCIWWYQHSLGPKNHARKIDNIHKGFGLHAYFSVPNCGDIPSIHHKHFDKAQHLVFWALWCHQSPSHTDQSWAGRNILRLPSTKSVRSFVCLVCFCEDFYMMDTILRSLQTFFIVILIKQHFIL